jgi:hypothetical protein
MGYTTVWFNASGLPAVLWLMVQAAHLDLHVGLSEKYPLNPHFGLPVAKHKFEPPPELCVSIREVEQFRLLVYDLKK